MSDTTLFVTIFSGVWGLVGIIFFTIGIVILKRQKNKIVNCTAKTYGKVIDIVRRTSHSNDGYSYSWHPVFEYEIGGLQYIKESSYGSTQPKFAVGQDIEIYYNPQDHHEFYVAGDTLPRTLGIIFTCVGIVLIIVALLVAVLMMHLKPDIHVQRG